MLDRGDDACVPLIHPLGYTLRYTEVHHRPLATWLEYTSAYPYNAGFIDEPVTNSIDAGVPPFSEIADCIVRFLMWRRCL